jgi:hypothetical protein
MLMWVLTRLRLALGYITGADQVFMLLETMRWHNKRKRHVLFKRSGSGLRLRHSLADRNPICRSERRLFRASSDFTGESEHITGPAFGHVSHNTISFLRIDPGISR